MLEGQLSGAKRILAVRLDNIGDVIMLGPALRSLKACLPEAHITLMASPAGCQVAPFLPWVDDTLEWRPIWQDVSGSLPLDPQRELDLIHRLRQGNFDAAVIFTSFSQSPFPPAYACYLAGIPVRIGQSKEFGGNVLTLEVKPPADCGHQVDRNLHLIEQAGIPVAGRNMELVLPMEFNRRVDEILSTAGVDPMQPFILLAPGASCPARRYDPRRFARAAELLPGAAGLPLIITGSAREAETLHPIIANAQPGQVISLVGQTNLGEYAALVRRAALVLTNNSSALHIADAFNRPMVVLYSGTEYEDQWRPRFSRHRLLLRKTWCSPCFLFRCPYNMECQDIPPEEVVDACLDVLDAVAGEYPFRRGESGSRIVGRIVNPTYAPPTTHLHQAPRRDSEC